MSYLSVLLHVLFCSKNKNRSINRIFILKTQINGNFFTSIRLSYKDSSYQNSINNNLTATEVLVLNKT
jgi:hypothetical protein